MIMYVIDDDHHIYDDGTMIFQEAELRQWRFGPLLIILTLGQVAILDIVTIKWSFFYEKIMNDLETEYGRYMEQWANDQYKTILGWVFELLNNGRCMY